MSTRYSIKNLGGQSVLTSRFDPTAVDTDLLAILEEQEHHGVRTDSTIDIYMIDTQQRHIIHTLELSETPAHLPFLYVMSLVSEDRPAHGGGLRVCVQGHASCDHQRTGRPRRRGPPRATSEGHLHLAEGTLLEGRAAVRHIEQEGLQ